MFLDPKCLHVKSLGGGLKPVPGRVLDRNSRPPSRMCSLQGTGYNPESPRDRGTSYDGSEFSHSFGAQRSAPRSRAGGGSLGRV